MHLQPVTNQASPYWDSLVRIYLQSFPLDEQRPVADIARLIAEDPRYTMYAIMKDNDEEVRGKGDEEKGNEDCHPETALNPKHYTLNTKHYTLNTKPIGLLTTWTFDSFTYIEHFALSPEVRGRGYGSEALAMLIARTEQPLILEAEPPTDELTRRRIGFYERSGFTLYDYPYVQPAYTADSQPVPLCLMGTLDTQDIMLDQVSRTLHREVYGCR
jgi:ribosomal protein S18 acetylase RimI-like enzyme